MNLLVGKNNCGKSSILEAVQLLVTGDTVNLTKIAAARDELEYYHDQDVLDNYGKTANASHFFHGHQIDLQSELSISSENSTFSMKIVGLSFLDDKSIPSAGIGNQGKLIPMEQEYLLHANSSITGERKTPLTQEGLIAEIHPFFNRPDTDINNNKDELLPIMMITSKSLDSASMSSLWDTVVIEGDETEAVKALQIIEPEVESIQFLSSYSSYGGVWLGLNSRKKRIPLGSMGDGVKRMLALSLALANVQGGVLLIDEIDTGLHWTVMEDMWKLIIQTADVLDIQIFATTHSQDCIRGLGDLLETSPHLGKHVSLQSIERRLEKAVNLNGEDICTAVEQEIEVR